MTISNKHVTCSEYKTSKTKHGGIEVVLSSNEPEGCDCLQNQVKSVIHKRIESYFMVRYDVLNNIILLVKVTFSILEPYFSDSSSTNCIKMSRV